MFCVSCIFVLAVVSCGNFLHTELYSAKRSDYYVRRAAGFEGPACSRLLQAAVDISPANETVVGIVTKAHCPVDGKSSGPPSLQIGPVPTWASKGLPASDCPEPSGTVVNDVFPTPVGFVHISDLGMKDWRKSLGHLRDVSIKRFQRIAKAKKRKGENSHDRSFVHINNQFFREQITIPEQAMAEPRAWPEMYKSQEYAEWALVARKVCVSYARKLGVPLSAHEEEELNIVLWAAVYPEEQKGDPVTHYYHAHQESIISFVLFTSMPEPTTPLTLGDPRGLPPTEDYEFFQNLGDLGVDGEPPFHRNLEFFASDGDVIVFPSYLIHKVPPHIGKGTRVVWPCNCELPKRAANPATGSVENPLDGWQRYVFWPATGLPGPVGARPDSVAAYRAHADAALQAAFGADDPYMKLWEVQNQIVAMLQFAPHSAETWIDAGNLTARAAVLLAAREEGDYFPDAATFLEKAWRIDGASKDLLKTLFKELSPKNAPRHLRQGYKLARQLSETVKKRRKEPEKEFIQFLHEDLNGPGKCKTMCPVSAPPPAPAMSILGLFSSRVFVAKVAPDEAEEEQILRISDQLLDGTRGVLKFTPKLECWWRDPAASLLGAVCSEAASLWFADPRGAWPERWAGSIDSSSPFWPTLVEGRCPSGNDASAKELLGTEPKAPFHRHSVVQCAAGEFVLFPAWLPYQIARGSDASIRPFAIHVPSVGNGTKGWRLPLVRPHCATATGRKRDEL